MADHISDLEFSSTSGDSTPDTQSLVSKDIEENTNNSVITKTDDFASPRETPSLTENGRDASSRVNSAPPPNWVYGTTSNLTSSATSSRSSGLCLSERGPIITVPQPEVIQNTLYPTTNALQENIISYREKVHQLLNNPKQSDLSIKSNSRNANPLLVIAGPSYVSDANQIKACAQWVGTLAGKEFQSLPEQILPEKASKLLSKRDTIPQNLLLSLRANLSQYNQSYGNYGNIDKMGSSVMTFEIEHGIPVCRALLCELAEICPIVGQISDTITPQFFNDLYCLGVVSSTLIESQLHREIVSGLSYPVGFQTSLTGTEPGAPFDRSLYGHKITAALDAMYASSNPHQFLSITKIGTVAVVGTVGNDDTFVILDIDTDVFKSESDILEFIDLVYKYSKLKETLHKPRIMLNVGSLSNASYDLKLKLVKGLLLNAAVSHKIIGVLIDSGNHYIPSGFHFELKEKSFYEEQHGNSADDHHDHQKLKNINNYFVKSGDFSHSDQALQPQPQQLGSGATEGHYEYEAFINADTFINELHEIRKSPLL